MVQVPAEMPDTMPVDEPTVATRVLLLLQCPPAVESDSVRVPPTHTLVVPLMPCMGDVAVTVTIM